MTCSEELVAFAWDTGTSTDGPRRAVARQLLDGLGTALASARLGVARPVVDVATALGGPPEATVLATGTRVGAPAAALANGTLVHGHDFDDTHADALVHPTAVLLAAGLAVGQEVRASGPDLLDAAVPAYEATIRIGAAAPHGFHGRGFHATSVVGVFGAALLAARLLDLSREQAVHALGIAGSMSAGTLEFLVDGVSTKQLHPGLAAMQGILATRLAAAGATGPRTVLEGDAGLFALYSRVPPDTAGIVADLGTRWELERITVKPYPVCQLSHASLDALGTVRSQVADPDAVTAIDVALPEDSMDIVARPADRKVRPQSTYEARFSLQYCLAVLLHTGHLGVDALGPEQLGDPAIRATAEKVTVTPAKYDVAPAAAPGHVTVHLRTGEVLEGRVATSRGAPGATLDDEALLDKFVANVGHEEARPLGHRVLALQDVAAVDDMVERAVAMAAATLGSRQGGPR